MSRRSGVTVTEVVIVIAIIVILTLLMYPTLRRQQLNEYGIKPESTNEFTIMQWKGHDILVHGMYNYQWGLHSPECSKCYK